MKISVIIIFNLVLYQLLSSFKKNTLEDGELFLKVGKRYSAYIAQIWRFYVHDLHLLSQYSNLHGRLWFQSVVNTGDVFPAVPSNKMEHWKQKANTVFFPCQKHLGAVWEMIYVHILDLIKILPVFTIKLNHITIKHPFTAFCYI